MRPRIDRDVPVAVWHVVGVVSCAISLVLLTVSALLSDSLGRAFVVVVTISLTLLVASVVAMRLLDGRERRVLLIWWPVLTCASAGAAGCVAPESTQALPGLLTLSFAYVGLCLPPHRAWWLLPFAAPALIAMLELDVAASLVRVPLTAVMWLLVAELPATLLARLSAQRAAFADASRTDSLTGLLNRATMHEALDGLGADDAVVLIDLDWFKMYNDALGHVAGDALLVEFAATLRECCPDGADVYRYGGEEFLLVLSLYSHADADALVATVASRWALHPSSTTFSAGVAPGGPDALRLADARMYDVKARRGASTPM